MGRMTIKTKGADNTNVAFFTMIDLFDSYTFTKSEDGNHFKGTIKGMVYETSSLNFISLFYSIGCWLKANSNLLEE